jgi:hypothetical protein
LARIVNVPPLFAEAVGEELVDDELAPQPVAARATASRAALDQRSGWRATRRATRVWTERTILI